MLNIRSKKPIVIALILIGALLLAFLLDAGVTLIEKKVHPIEYKEIIEKYVDVLCDLEALFVKKAFCKGCEFAVSFLLEARNLEK